MHEAGSRTISQPGVPRSTRKRFRRRRPGRARRRSQPWSPPVTNHFSPSRTHSSPSLVAAVIPDVGARAGLRNRPRLLLLVANDGQHVLGRSVLARELEQFARSARSATMKPRPLVGLPASSIATCASMGRSGPSCSAGGCSWRSRPRGPSPSAPRRPRGRCPARGSAPRPDRAPPRRTRRPPLEIGSGRKLGNDHRTILTVPARSSKPHPHAAPP